MSSLKMPPRKAVVMRLARLLVILISLGGKVVSGYQISVKVGDNFTFDLPSVSLCGPYTLLSPLLSPIVSVEGANTTNVIGEYFRRAEVTQTPDGFRFRLTQARQSDMGRYKVAASDQQSPACIDRAYFVTVTGTTDEYFKPWGEWSTCSDVCSSVTSRTRSRECTLMTGCYSIGPLQETQKCSEAEECANWGGWGPWGACSARCGKGFKMRKRACVSGKVLVSTSRCAGHSTQSHMCLTVCQVVGTWTEWSEWSACQCGDVTRSRDRTCSTDTASTQRMTSENCTGNRTEEETCLAKCLEPEVTTVVLAAGGLQTSGAVITDGQTDASLTVSSMVAGIACAVAVIIILVVVLLLKRRNRTRRESVPALRPADEAPKRRAKKSSAQQRPQSKGRKSSAGITGSGNVYSELANSNLQWPSSEFDSTYSAFNGGFSPETENAKNENAQSAMNGENRNDVIDPEDFADDVSNDSGEFDHVFDDARIAGRETMCERKEITYATQRVSFQRPSFDSTKTGSVSTDPAARPSVTSNVSQATTDSDADVVTENLYYEPPELWDIDENEASSLNSHPVSNLALKKAAEAMNDFNTGSSGTEETDEVYYEPPVGEDNSKVERKVTATNLTQPIFQREESIYENCEVNNTNLDHKTSIASVHSVNEPSNGKVKESNSDNNRKCSDIKKDLENLFTLIGNKKSRKLGVANAPEIACPRYSDVLDDTSVSLNKPHSSETSQTNSSGHAKKSSLAERSDVKVDMVATYSDEDLDSDHVYVNSKAGSSPAHFYVTPKYHYGPGLAKQDGRKESIYDVPK